MTQELNLYHLTRPPSTEEKNPASIFLFHGYGSNEEDLFSFASELPPQLRVISARAPHPMPPFGNAWYALNLDASHGKWSDIPQAIKSREMISQFIDSAIEYYDLDPTRVTLLGFSQGAVLSYAVALSYPEKVKNLIALSGYIDKELLTEEFDSKNHDNLNIYVSHGQVDQVIPPDWAYRSSDFLKSHKLEHIFEEYPVGHGVSPQNFYSLKRWLEDRI